MKSAIKFDLSGIDTTTVSLVIWKMEGKNGPVTLATADPAAPTCPYRASNRQQLPYWMTQKTAQKLAAQLKAGFTIV